jgi:hypothetical protein
MAERRLRSQRLSNDERKSRRILKRDGTHKRTAKVRRWASHPSRENHSDNGTHSNLRSSCYGEHPCIRKHVEGQSLGERRRDESRKKHRYLTTVKPRKWYMHSECVTDRKCAGGQPPSNWHRRLKGTAVRA